MPAGMAVQCQRIGERVVYQPRLNLGDSCQISVGQLFTGAKTYPVEKLLSILLRIEPVRYTHNCCLVLVV